MRLITMSWQFSECSAGDALARNPCSTYLIAHKAIDCALTQLRLQQLCITLACSKRTHVIALAPTKCMQDLDDLVVEFMAVDDASACTLMATDCANNKRKWCTLCTG
jgi:hypothetical protein